MEVRPILSALAGLLVIAGYVPYIRSILTRRTVPAKASWLIWASLDTILLYGMFLRDAVNGQILGTVLVIWVVVALAFVYGRSGWTYLDKACLTSAAVGMILTLANPTWSIVLLAIVSFVGAFPTFRSAWDQPSGEDKLTWTLYWLSCVLTVLAVPSWTISSGAQPVSFFVVQTIMMYLLFARRGRTRLIQKAPPALT